MSIEWFSTKDRYNRPRDCEKVLVRNGEFWDVVWYRLRSNFGVGDFMISEHGESYPSEEGEFTHWGRVSL